MYVVMFLRCAGFQSMGKFITTIWYLPLVTWSLDEGKCNWQHNEMGFASWATAFMPREVWTSKVSPCRNNIQWSFFNGQFLSSFCCRPGKCLYASKLERQALGCTRSSCEDGMG